MLSVNQLPGIAGKIYPNPFDGKIFIEPEKANELELTLTNLQRQILNKAQHQNVESVDLENLPAGIYIYRIKTGDGLKQGKIIKR